MGSVASATPDRPPVWAADIMWNIMLKKKTDPRLERSINHFLSTTFAGETSDTGIEVDDADVEQVCGSSLNCEAVDLDRFSISLGYVLD